MKEFYKVTIWAECVSFNRATFFGTIRKKEMNVKNQIFAGFDNYFYFGSMRKVIENENEIEDMKEKFKKDILQKLEKDYKNVSINNIEWNVSIAKASEQTAEWCIKNLTIPQLVEMGLTLMREDD